MRKLMIRLAALVFALALTGCGSSVPVEETQSKPLASRLGDAIDFSLAELLTRPRKELAEKANEVAKEIQIQEKGRREGRRPFTLIPKLRLPLAVPVLREAQFSAKTGFSLPPYLAEDSKDSALALHLARHGDGEAANKLVEPGDTEAKQRIQAARFQRDYPVEWTRLVGLLLHRAQLRLATGDVEGGTELTVMHRELRTVLDAKAAKGALGAVLLSQGRQTLTRAAAAWREEKMVELADQADGRLADWGEVPGLTLAFATGMPRAQVAQLLRSPGEGRVLPAVSIARAFDLFALPFPDEGAEAVVASFDDADRLANVLLTYRAGFGEHFPAPAQLAFLIEEQQVKAEDDSTMTGLHSRKYRFGELDCTVSVVVHGAGVGAFVRLGSANDMPRTAKLERDFGEANLDRTFEQNRIRVAPEQRGDKPVAMTAKALSQLRNPLPALQLDKAELRRENGQNLTAALVLRSTVNSAGAPPLSKLAMPLWRAYGLGQFQGVSDKNGGHLAVTWEDARTQYTLRLPYDTQAVELEISDRQGPEKRAEREKAALTVDRQERAQRLKGGKPIVRIAPYLEDFELELGMKRNLLLQRLPPGQGVVKRNMPGGLAILFRGEAPRTETYVLRQLFARFDPADHLVELRARYTDGPAAGRDTRWMTDLLKKLSKRAGAPAEAPSPWAKLWVDLPPQSPPPLLYRWQDDKTLLVYQRDAAGVEIALRDCSADKELGQPPPPLEYLSRGPAKLQLGEQRAQILQRWGVNQPVLAGDGALILRPPQGSPFDALLVYFDNEHAARIVARHVPAGANRVPAPQAVTDAWGRELATLGWPRRHDLTPNDAVEGLGWHDDRTRIRIFWQDTEGPPRVFTEWKDLTP